MQPVEQLKTIQLGEKDCRGCSTASGHLPVCKKAVLSRVLSSDLSTKGAGRRNHPVSSAGPSSHRPGAGTGRPPMPAPSVRADLVGVGQGDDAEPAGGGVVLLLLEDLHVPHIQAGGCEPTGRGQRGLSKGGLQAMRSGSGFSQPDSQGGAVVVLCGTMVWCSRRAQPAGTSHVRS